MAYFIVHDIWFSDPVLCAVVQEPTPFAPCNISVIGSGKHKFGPTPWGICLHTVYNLVFLLCSGMLAFNNEMHNVNVICNMIFVVREMKCKTTLIDTMTHVTVKDFKDVLI